MKADEGTVTRPSPGVRGRARRAYPTHRGFQTAYVKGWYARRVGRSRDACPYRGRAMSRTGGTFTFAWRAAWTRGYDAADAKGSR